MSDTNAQLASIADKVRRGEVSPGVAGGAARAACSSATEFRARKLFYAGVAALKNNALDAADLSTAFREDLLKFYRDLSVIEPKATDWDKAMGMGQ